MYKNEEKTHKMYNMRRKTGNKIRIKITFFRRNVKYVIKNAS